MSVFHNNALIGAGGGTTAAAAAAVATKSLRFNSGDSAFLSRTPSSSGNRKTFTFSAWVKRTVLVAGNSPNKEIFIVVGTSNTTHFQLGFRADKLYVANLNTFLRVTDADFRDTSAWYHIVLAVDTTQSTADDRIKLYVNGSQITSFSSSSNPSQNSDTGVNHTQQHNIGKEDHYFDGYMADIYLIDGSALTPSSFGAYDDNGVWQASAYSGTYGTNGFHLAFGDSTSSAALGTDSSGNSNTFTVNNINGDAVGLSTADQGFGVLTYTGNATARNISGLSFAPDLVIIKSRSDSGFHHYWIDRVRGTGKNLFSNLTEGEQSADRLSSFNSDGIGLTDHTGVNKSGSNFVAWCWKAGGAASSNTDGTITSSVSASTTYGFSVVGYQGNNTAGATVGHGLSSTPKWIVVKSRDQNGQFWHVYHASLDADEYAYLNNSNAVTSGNDFMNGTRPTSSVFSLGNGNGCNKSGDNVIAYCWAEVSGFSKISSYNGSGGAATKVVTGFRPRFIIARPINDSNGNRWHIVDTDRGVGGSAERLFAEDATVHTARQEVLIENDGFVVTNTTTDSGSLNRNTEYIYAAFASKPSGEDIDSMFDVPTNGDQTDTGAGGEVSGNYCTMNAVHSNSTVTFSDGNLHVSNSSGWWSHTGTVGVTSGKWYYELQKTSGSYIGVGWRNDATSQGNPSHNANGGGIYTSHNGYKQSSAGAVSYGATWGNDDIIGVAFDRDAGTITFYKNGVSQGQAFTGMTDGIFMPEVQIYQSGARVNFGQRPFVHSAPSNHKAVCTANLATPTIADGRDYFDAKLWTGNSTDQRAISGYQFSPDWVWIKRRNASYAHPIMDTVRGLNSGHAGVLYANATNSEDTGATSSIRSFNSDGFNLGTDGGINYSGSTYVGWAWDAGSSTVSNSNGSITSQVRANPSAGFSIVTYTGNGTSGATVGHGLSAAPAFWMLKARSATSDWVVRHTSLANTHYLVLNSTAAAYNPISDVTGDADPTSSVIPVGDSDSNNNNVTHVGYIFSPVAGYSSIGEYDGNGSTDGPFIHTGFRVAFLILKCHTATELWMMHDSTRDPDNVVSKLIQPHTSDAEIDSVTNYGVDFLSNGFKFRSSSNRNNGSGKSYIYLAFAENPFQANGGLAR